MQRADHAVHLAVVGGALPACDTRQRLVVDDAARQEVHDVERAAQDGEVFAVQVDPRHRYVAVAQRLHDAELTVDGMRRGQQLSRRPGAQHVLLRTARDPVGRVGLAARQALQRQPGLRDQAFAVQQSRQRGAVESGTACAGRYRMGCLHRLVLPGATFRVSWPYGRRRRAALCPLLLACRADQAALTMSSTTFLASPNTIMVLSM
ncbi:hypothetical protein D3C81_1677840 [compost metagenome]